MNYSFHGLRLASEIRLPEIRRSRRAGDVTIDLGGGAGTSRHDWFHRWPLDSHARGSRRSWLSFARLEDGYLLRFHDLCDFEVRSGSRRITCRPVAGLPAPTLRHLLLDQVMPLVLSQCGRLVLHASAVHVDGFGAVAFAGRAGAGKSTLAAAIARRAGCAVVTDDCLVIDLESGQPMAIPGYAGMRLWPDSVHAFRLSHAGSRDVAHYTAKRRVGGSLRFRERRTPLRRVFVLGRRTTAGSAFVRRLRPRDALVTLAEYAYLMDVTDRSQLTATFRQLGALVERVPLARLSIAEGWRFMGRSADEVLALAAADS